MIFKNKFPPDHLFYCSPLDPKKTGDDIWTVGGSDLIAVKCSMMMNKRGRRKERNAPTLPKQYLDGRLGASQRWQIHNQNPPVHKESVKFGQFLTKMSPSDLDPLFAHNTGEFQEPPTK